MKELNFNVNPIDLNHKDEVVSFKCELQENLQKAMKKFGIKSPAELDDEKKKEFFNYVDKNYSAKNEKD